MTEVFRLAVCQVPGCGKEIRVNDGIFAAATLSRHNYAEHRDKNSSKEDESKDA